jgi:hypothetical protein
VTVSDRGRRKVHNDELYNFYSSQILLGVQIKEGKMYGRDRNTHKVLVGKPERKSLGA